MQLKAGVQFQHSADLRLGQCTREIALNSDGFERAPRYVVPLPLEGGRNVLSQLDCDLYGLSSSFYRRRWSREGAQRRRELVPPRLSLRRAKTAAFRVRV